MAKPTTKAEMLQAATEKYQELSGLIASMTERELATSFDFTKMKSKKEAHWSRDKNLRDVLIHLYEWHQLLLGWVAANQRGENKSFLPAPYNWRTYGEMNREIWSRHQNTTLEAARELLEQSHREVMALAETFSERELFEKDVFPWVGNAALAGYFASNMSSHYEWAIKKLKAHRKNCREY
ncbi:MAG: ClbS/DfsB family four-helix bundle protein [Lachnospiraceae bacterium]|nr:ClbS/DfsB family four-helix bundle protein [Lachnospiraceae bacterium]